MNNIIKSLFLLLCSIGIFTACESDRDSNPVIGSPSTFTLNTPPYAALNIDLTTSDNVSFTWSQPYYGYPAACEYQLQVSLNNSFTNAYLDENDDNSNADYITLSTYFNTASGSVTASALATALQKIGGWEESAVPTSQSVYVRATCHVKGSSASSNSDTIYSNAVIIGTIPYYVELRDADPQIWYLIGDEIGNGGWNNSATAIGTSMYPLFTVTGQEYDRTTGTGILKYTGYFHAGKGFKIIETVGNWDYGIVNGGSPGTTAYRSGGSDPGNITVATDGYYTITLNTATHACTIEEYTETPSTYTAVSLATSDDTALSNATALSVFNTANSVNHDWVTTVTIAADGSYKFAANNSWTTSWGSSEFPRGTGVLNSTTNIPAKAGTYKVFFNDILGSYQFVAQ